MTSGPPRGHSARMEFWALSGKGNVMHAYRSHTCAGLNTDHVAQTVRLSGWVHRVRDHGGVLFIDLRDHYGITQVIADSDSPAFADLEKLRAECVICVDGRVKARDAALVNPKLPTGAIEVYATGVTVLGAADDLPMPVFGDVDYPEETRLTYRFLDLRREKLHANMMLRSNVVRSMRNRMWDQGFTEFQTPIITASSPEGARDFLVPSRLHPGKFYALPQAPQQFKQLIMVAGFDRYFQIAPCFRDERGRPPRTSMNCLTEALGTARGSTPASASSALPNLAMRVGAVERKAGEELRRRRGAPPPHTSSDPQLAQAPGMGPAQRSEELGLPPHGRTPPGGRGRCARNSSSITNGQA